MVTQVDVVVVAGTPEEACDHILTTWTTQCIRQIYVCDDTMGQVLQFHFHSTPIASGSAAWPMGSTYNNQLPSDPIVPIDAPLPVRIKTILDRMATIEP